MKAIIGFFVLLCSFPLVAEPTLPSKSEAFGVLNSYSSEMKVVGDYKFENLSDLLRDLLNPLAKEATIKTDLTCIQGSSKAEFLCEYYITETISNQHLEWLTVVSFVIREADGAFEPVTYEATAVVGG